MIENNACETTPINSKYDLSLLLGDRSVLTNTNLARPFLLGGVHQFTAVDCEFNSFRAHDCVVSASRFLDTRFKQAEISGCTFNDVCFKNVSLETATLRFTHFNNCIFDRCTLLFLQELTETDAVIFRRCIFIDMNIAALKAVTLEDCMLKGAVGNSDLPKEAGQVLLETSAPKVEQDVPSKPGKRKPMGDNRFNKLEWG